jgi:hypothetical protein
VILRSRSSALIGSSSAADGEKEMPQKSVEPVPILSSIVFSGPSRSSWVPNPAATATGRYRSRYDSSISTANSGVFAPRLHPGQSTANATALLPLVPRSMTIRTGTRRMMRSTELVVNCPLGDGARCSPRSSGSTSTPATSPTGPCRQPVRRLRRGRRRGVGPRSPQPWRFSIDPGAGLNYVADAGSRRGRRSSSSTSPPTPEPTSGGPASKESNASGSAATPRISSFGVDAEGEPYLVVHDGFLAMIVPVRSPAGDPVPSEPGTLASRWRR